MQNQYNGPYRALRTRKKASMLSDVAAEKFSHVVRMLTHMWLGRMQPPHTQ